MGDTKEFWAVTPPQGEGSRPPAGRPRGDGKDPTPSFLRGPGPDPAGARPPRRESLAPVLAVQRSWVAWRWVRRAAIALAAVAVIAAAALFVRDRLIRKEVEETISRALVAESKGGADGIRAAREELSRLAQRRPDRGAALEAAAWMHVAEALLYGPEEALSAPAAAALRKAQGDRGALGLAAAAGLEVMGDRAAEGLRIAERGIAAHPGEPRLRLVRAAALVAGGDRRAGLDSYVEAAIRSPTYLPLPIAGLEAAIEGDDPERALSLAALLETAGEPAKTLVALARAVAPLGGWGGDGRGAGPPPALGAELARAPQKVARLGRYVEGRALLAGGMAEKAAAALEAAAGPRAPENVVAWHGLAVLRSAGPDAALALLDARPGARSPAVLDLRARCLLACDRVDAAAPVVEALGGTGALPGRAADLALELSVKRGDTAAALDALPDGLPGGRAGLAVELFFQLEEAGDRKGVARLAKAMGGELSDCAKVMRTWHTKAVGPAVKKMTAEEAAPCAGALAARLLWGRVEPWKLGRALARATPEMRARPQVAVTGAMVAWLTDGRDAALAILDGVEALKPQAAPTRRALARAYLEMELPERAIRALGGVEGPEALGLLYRAEKERKGGDAGELVRRAEEENGRSPHPALAYVAVHAAFAGGDHKRAARGAEEILPNGGRWTAEIAETGAKAINLSGDRSDADRLLTGTAKRLGASLGADELWDLQLAFARLNLLRGGGKFLRRAENALGEMKRGGALDARIAFNEGMVAMRSGDRDEAAAAFRRALELNPSIGAAYAQLRKLGELDGEAAARMGRILPGFEP